jgi:hypothetical protein
VTRPMLRLTPLLAALLLSLAVAPAASAASRDAIIKDCADDGSLQGKYSASELRDARKNLPSDVAEYTDCADVLRRAELPDRGGDGGAGGGAGGGGGSTAAGGGTPLVPETDADRQELSRAVADGDQPVTVNGEKVVPGASGLTGGGSRNGLPGALLAGLILIGIGGIGLAVPALKKLPFLRGTPGIG